MSDRTIPLSDFCYCQTLAGLFMWGGPNYERTGLSFIIVAGPRQRSHSRSETRGTDQILLSHIRDSPTPHPGGPGPRIYILEEQGGPVIPPGTGVSFHRPPTIRRPTVEVFESVSTWALMTVVEVRNDWCIFLMFLRSVRPINDYQGHDYRFHRRVNVSSALFLRMPRGSLSALRRCADACRLRLHTDTEVWQNVSQPVNSISIFMCLYVLSLHCLVMFHNNICEIIILVIMSGINFFYS
jgi:hypothetical protein